MRRVLLAVVLSLGAHLALWAALARTPPPRPGLRSALVEVDFLPPRVTPPEPAPPPPPAPVPPAPRPVRPRSEVPVSARESEPVVLPPPAPAPVAPLVDDLPRLTPSLLPRGTFAIAVVDAGTLTLPAPTESERAQAMVSTLARETLGRGKVDRGLVHPYYAQLGKVLIRTWDADRAVSRSGLKGFAEQFVENSKTWNAIWQSRAEQFGKTGTPSANETQGRRAPTNDRLGADLAARREIQKEMAAQFRTTRRALVRVTQRADGTLASVDLVAPSMDPQVDREALVDVRAAAQQLPTPPPEVLRGRETLTSLWELELVISISPPVPTFTFEFDEVLGYVDPRLPLDRRIYKKVRLVEVD